jgi:hypothetical protein
MKTPEFYVYTIRSKTSGKAYYGSTNNFKRRRNQHLQLLRRGTHHSAHLQNAWNAYQEHDFLIEILHTFATEADMLICEKSFLSDLTKTYNVSSEVDKGHTRGRPRSAETKAKLSAMFKGRFVSEETKAKIRAARAKQTPRRAGMTHSDLTKSIIKAKRALQVSTNKGRKFGKVARANMGAARIGKEYPRVRVLTPNGVFVGVKKAAEHFGINPATVRYRVKVKNTGWAYESI